MDFVQLPNEEVRQMLRDSLRGFLGEQWRADGKQATPPDGVSAIWTKLVGQGVASLGCDFTEGGLREILVVMSELGRVACPAPMWSVALANLALSGVQAEAAVDLLEQLHAGKARVAFSFGALDPDRNTGSVQLENGHASGLLRFVEVAESCTHLLVAGDKSALAVVELGAPGVSIGPTRALGAWGLHEVRLVSAPAALVALEHSVLDKRLIEGKLALMARAYGAARRAFELSVDYAKERKQLGQAIGKFQAIQHKLADSLIALEGVRLTLDHAAYLHDRNDRDWHYFASSAVAFAGARCGVSRLKSSTLSGRSDTPKNTRRRGTSSACISIRLRSAARRTRGDASPRFCSMTAVPDCRNMISARPGTICANRRGRGWKKAGRGNARPSSTRNRSQSVSSMPNSRAISARRAGSDWGGRRNSAARRAPRSSKSPSWKRWSAPRRRGLVRRFRPTP